MKEEFVFSNCNFMICFEVFYLISMKPVFFIGQSKFSRIENGMKFHLHITTVKPAEKGSNKSYMICHTQINIQDLILVMVLSSVI